MLGLNFDLYWYASKQAVLLWSENLHLACVTTRRPLSFIPLQSSQTVHHYLIAEDSLAHFMISLVVHTSRSNSQKNKNTNIADTFVPVMYDYSWLLHYFPQPSAVDSITSRTGLVKAESMIETSQGAVGTRVQGGSAPSMSDRMRWAARQFQSTYIHIHTILPLRQSYLKMAI